VTERQKSITQAEASDLVNILGRMKFNYKHKCREIAVVDKRTHVRTVPFRKRQC